MKISRNKVLLVPMLFFIFSGTLFASDSGVYSKYSGQQVGQGFFNGRFWIHVNEFQREIFLSGLQDGMKLVTMKLPSEERSKLAPELACGLTNAEIEPLISNFYDDAYNLKIPIVSVYSLIVFKANGGSPAEFEERLSVLRKIWQ